MDGLALESGAFENAQAIPNRHSCEGTSTVDSPRTRSTGGRARIHYYGRVKLMVT